MFGQGVLQVINVLICLRMIWIRFNALLSNKKYPVQIIWAGKPYPVDYPAITQFNNLVHLSKNYKNVAVLLVMN